MDVMCNKLLDTSEEAKKEYRAFLDESQAIQRNKRFEVHLKYAQSRGFYRNITLWAYTEEDAAHKAKESLAKEFECPMLHWIVVDIYRA